MYHNFTYEAALASSLRARWNLDDVLQADQELDFSRNFLPESLARTAHAEGLTPNERRTLNQISAHYYICMFMAVEEFILPFLLNHALPVLCDGDIRTRALRNFAEEEDKHIRLFRRFHEAFVRGFPVKCRIFGKSEKLAEEVLGHHPLAIGLIILMIEWMTQAHYLGSIRDDGDIDPLFKSLFKNHWMEEAQHAKLDTLIVDAMAEGLDAKEIDWVIDEWFKIGIYLDTCLKIQARCNVETLENSIGRQVPNRNQLIAQQHNALRWTFLGSGMVHERFNATLEAISPRAAARVARVADRIAQVADRFAQEAAPIAHHERTSCKGDVLAISLVD